MQQMEFANANDNILLEEDGTTELGLEPIREDSISITRKKCFNIQTT